MYSEVDIFLPINFSSNPNGVYLIELTRTSPSLINAPGVSNNAGDYSAKVTSMVPPLAFLLNSAWKTPFIGKDRV